MTKYFWYSPEYGLGDDFSTKEDCVADAIKMYEEYPAEYGIYCYDSEKHPNGDVDIDDCEYLEYIGGE